MNGNYDVRTYPKPRPIVTRTMRAHRSICLPDLPPFSASSGIQLIPRSFSSIATSPGKRVGHVTGISFEGFLPSGEPILSHSHPGASVVRGWSSYKGALLRTV